MSLFSSPMMLLSLFSLGMLFLMPKLTAGMDPEELKELQSKQINPNNVQLPDVSNMLASYLSGASTETKKQAGSNSKSNSPKK